MTDLVEEPGQQQPWTPTKTSAQNGIRTTGRAFSSPNWRVKSEESPSNGSPRTSNQQSNSSRSPFNRSSPQVPPAIAEGRRLYVGNMPYMANKEDIVTLFREGNYKIERVDISIDPFTGRNPSYCFVELETRDQAHRAMKELDGKDLLGRPVKVKPGVAKSNQERTFPSQTNDSPSPRSTDDRSPHSFDRWQRNDASNHFKGYSDQGRRLYVGGLPKLSNQAAIDSEIQTFFKGFNIEAISKLISPHPSKRFEPGNHYYLFVDFSTADEASAAMNALDGQEGPWGEGKIRVGKARGESWKPDERKNWATTRGRDLSSTAPETSERTAVAA